MQLPQVIRLFGQQTHVYTLLVGSAIIVVVLLAVTSSPRGMRRRAFDACLIALALALVLARAEHVLLRWDYYIDHLDQALDLRRGGLGWHGAALGAWLGLTIFRGVYAIPYALLALALTIMAAAAWVGCAAAGCAYGAEVRTLADYPPGVVAELRDVYGIIAPRWNTPLYGVVLAAVVLGISILGLKRTRNASSLQGDPVRTPLRALRTFFLALAVFAFGMFVIGYARADAVAMIVGVRGDQALDAATLIVCASALVRNARTP